MKNIILFDATCPFCQSCVKTLMKLDTKNRLSYAPLGGKTAQMLSSKYIATFPSLVLAMEKTHLMKMKAILKALWIIGGKWKWLGWLYIIYPQRFDLIYHLIAKYRSKLFRKSSEPYSKPLLP